MRRNSKAGPLAKKLAALNHEQPASWAFTGRDARPTLHGMIRYPAMMVPRMQGDIIDAVLGESGSQSVITDPFVGSGTTMTESLVRGVDFKGYDINPLAVMVCEAKAAIDGGVRLHDAVEVLLLYVARDATESIDVSFAGLEKWFSTESAVAFSRWRRGIMQIQDADLRKIMWVVFADTMRLCSNSRTSTYKLHVRAEGVGADPARIEAIFRANLKDVLDRVSEYREAIKFRRRRPKIQIVCEDILRAKVSKSKTRHEILVTSPPYGDNKTTIPYGQFSFLALSWIPSTDLPSGWNVDLAKNSNSIDRASLGGTIQATDSSELSKVSPAFRKFMSEARSAGKEREVRKVSAFMSDYFKALTRMAPKSSGGAHWILTTGNRRAAGLLVPFDKINEEIVRHLEGTCIASIKRKLPVKRMPSRNSIGEMITTETTLVAEFD